MVQIRPVAFLLALLAVAVHAADPVVVAFRAERVDAPDWRVADIDATIELHEGGQRGRVRIGRVELPGAELEFSDTVIDCAEILLSRTWLRCHDATLTLDFPVAGRQTVTGRFDYEREPGILHFALQQLALAGGRVALEGRTGDFGTELEWSGAGLAIAELVAIANSLDLGPGELAAGGSADARGSLRTDSTGQLALSLDASLAEASVANDAGTVVAEAVTGTLRLNAEQAGEAWQFDLSLAADRGEAYVEPVYANLAEHPLAIELGRARTADFARYEFGRFALTQGDQAELAGTARIHLPPGEEPLRVEAARIEISDTAVETLYTNLLQIAFAGTVLGDLETAGRVSGEVTIENDAPMSADLELDGVILDDRRRRFAIYGLGGSLHWPGPAGAPGDAPPSRLAWDSGNAQCILRGGASAALALGGDDLVLLESLRVPTMGGALLVNRLEIHDYGRDDARGLLDAELEPVQLGQLTGAFGWPAFSGSLSGRLPLLTYEGNAMTVGGRLTARAFDGDIELANLRIAQPFGRVPRLSGDLTFRSLDLERVTNTFSFGLIQGRLSGEVAGLEAENWRPVAMDARLYSTPGDRTPRRISQRAVENLASVGGGGAGAVLSTGFLKFFEVFAYEEIGLRCVLANGVCRMSGAGPAGEGALGRGYYIVKGRGIPRIDVIGYRERVGWNALLQQLSAITRDSTPVVN